MPPQTEPTHFQCRHIKPDGHRCGSPSLRHEHFCYYHHTARRPGPRQPQVLTTAARKASTFQLPSPADLSERSGVGLALGLVLHKIANNEVDPRRAGLLLYGLQIASVNLRREGTTPGTKSSPVEDIADDPIYGLLAPAAELGDNEPQGVIQRLLEQLEREADAPLTATLKPEATTIRTMQATAEPRRPRRRGLRQPSRPRNPAPLPAQAAAPPPALHRGSLTEPWSPDRTSAVAGLCREKARGTPAEHTRGQPSATLRADTLERSRAHGSRQPPSLQERALH